MPATSDPAGASPPPASHRPPLSARELTLLVVPLLLVATALLLWRGTRPVGPWDGALIAGLLLAVLVLQLTVLASQWRMRRRLPTQSPQEVRPEAGAAVAVAAHGGGNGSSPVPTPSDELRLLALGIESCASEILLVRAGQLIVCYANHAARRNLQLGDDALPGHLNLRDVAVIEGDLEQQIDAILRRAPTAGGTSPLANATLHTEGAEPQARWPLTMCRADGTRYVIAAACSAIGEGADRYLMLFGAAPAVAPDTPAQRASHERDALAVQASRDGLCDIDLATGAVYVSTRAAAMLGYDDAAQFLGQSPQDAQIELLLDHIHPADRARVELLHDAYLERRNDEFDAEYRYRTRSGVYRWLHARGQAIWDDAGAAARYALCLTDVTQRKLAEAMLQDTVSRLGAVLQHVADGIMTLDSDGRIRSFNPAAERIFGWSQEDVLDQPVTALVPHLATISALPLDQALRAIAGSESCVALRRDGVTLPIEITATRMIVADAEMYTALVRDVSERRNVEAELRRARDTAEAGLRAKSEFLAVMSHEVRTPLNGVLGMAQLLHEMSLTQEQEETVRTIQRSGEALLSIINDLLDCSKIEAGRMQLEYAPFDIGFAVREVFDLLAPNAREQGLEMILDYARDLPRRVLGDVTRFRQILLNLCGNAVKFTRDGHVAVTITELSRGGDTVRLRVAVADTGIGIDPSVQAQLFKPFVQADASTTRRFGGTGLGLAICGQLVELMVGSIGVTSTPGVGSEFAFELGMRIAPDELWPLPVPPGAGHRALVFVPHGRAGDVLARDLGLLGFVAGRASSLDQVLAADAELIVADVAALSAEPVAAVAALRRAGLLQRTLLLVPGVGHVDHGRVPTVEFGAVVTKPLHASDLAAALERLGLAAAAGVRDGAATAGVGRNAGRMVLPPGSAPPREVLVVEDNLVNQRVARRMLEYLGWRVEVAGNGREALVACQQRTFALIFMDVRMPEMDGFEATRAIRALEQISGAGPTPIVAMTANAGASDERECRAAGMSDFLGKPISVAELRRVLSVWAGAVPAPRSSVA